MRLLALVVLLASAGCLDWPGLYEKPCDGTACDASTGDARVPGVDAGAAPDCGDGVVDPGEECDDGNYVDTDSCRNGCKWATCGDGVVRTGVEECDDGNANDEDACARCLACAVDGDTFFWSVTSSCYEFRDMPYSRDEASDACATDSTAALLSIDQNDEEIVVEEAMRSPAERSFWLGMKRGLNGFQWLSGRNLRRTFWAQGEPAEHACAIETIDAVTDAGDGTEERSFDWYARDCDEDHPFICERSVPFLSDQTNHAYFAVFHPTTWSDARARCAALGAHLATITDDVENGDVAQAASASVWLGAEAQREPREFKWITNEPFVFQAFHPTDYPSDDEEQRCLMYDAVERGWFDKLCSEKHGYLCEFD
jgi:cysteine-rich repeat protein